MVTKTTTMRQQTSSSSAFQESTPLTQASTHEGNMTMSKFAKVIAHSALVATLLTLLSTVASASAVWGN